MGWTAVGLTGGEDPAHIMAGCRAAVLRAGWPAGTGLRRFRCTSRRAGLRVQVPEPPEDTRWCQLVRLGRLLPGPPQVGGQRAGQSELGVGRDHHPCPSVGRFRAAKHPYALRSLRLAWRHACMPRRGPLGLDPRRRPLIRPWAGGPTAAAGTVPRSGGQVLALGRTGVWRVLRTAGRVRESRCRSGRGPWRRLRLLREGGRQTRCPVPLQYGAQGDEGGQWHAGEQ